ncbi:MAG: hypothetical protein FWE01_03525 [Firmicutes bacterium]|nr:hypothetical protein [Bacillota bacterium]
MLKKTLKWIKENKKLFLRRCLAVGIVSAIVILISMIIIAVAFGHTSLGVAFGEILLVMFVAFIAVCIFLIAFISTLTIIDFIYELWTGKKLFFTKDQEKQKEE